MKNYNFLKSSKYALEGLFVLFKEKAFIIELIFIIPLITSLFFLDIQLVQKSIMFMSLVGILIVEALNTSIEYVVDLVTDEWKEFAKKAKDTVSSAVMLSILNAVVIWSINLYF